MSKPANDQPPPLDQPADDASVDRPPKDGLDSFAGRPDQDVKHTLGPGAGGATEWGGGNKNHPSRIKGKPPGS